MTAPPSPAAIAGRWLCALVLCACGDVEVPPKSCAEGGIATHIDDVEIGDAGDLGSPFVPFDDDDVTHIVLGLQGGSMIGVRLRARGLDGACMMQESFVHSSGGEQLAAMTYPVDTIQVRDGTRTTPTLWLVLEGELPVSGESVLVSSSVYGEREERTLWIDHRP